MGKLLTNMETLMAISFKVIEKKNPADASAPAKYYASSSVSSKSGIEEITEQIEKISTVSGADIRAVLYALVDVVPGMLSKGENVKVGDMGTFRVSISSSGSDTPEAVTANNIRGAKIIFTPGKKFKTMLQTLKYEKVS